MRRAAALALLSFAIAGCGSQAAAPSQPTKPHLPRALAQKWVQQADAIAASLAANDDCTAKTQIDALQQDVVAAVNGHRIPQRLLEPLSGGVNDLAQQVTCVPPLTPSPGKSESRGEGKGKGKEKGKGHQKHGKEGGD